MEALEVIFMVDFGGVFDKNQITYNNLYFNNLHHLKTQKSAKKV